jgi:hypothetical protein
MHLCAVVTCAPVYIDPGFNLAISQLFSASLLKRLEDEQHECKIRSLLIRSGLYTVEQPWCLAHALECAYDYLRGNYRCEYVYKNEIARQLLLRNHSDKSATLLREVASDKAIADIVIVNGKTVAYEIKTELDNFDRLTHQLESYRILYDQVYVVTHVNAIAALSKRIPDFVGIYILDDQAQLCRYRLAQCLSNQFEPTKASVIMRQAELVEAYENCVGKLPLLGSAAIFGFCRAWFEALPQTKARELFYYALKSRYPAQHQHDSLLTSIESIKMLLLGRDLTKRLCTTVSERLGSIA